LAGLLIVHGHPLVWLIGGLFFGFAYVSIVAAEEGFLAAKFGPDYAAYCAQVNRWLPDIRRLGEAHEDMTFNWRQPCSRWPPRPASFAGSRSPSA
jgi:hypothetical protein